MTKYTLPRLSLLLALSVAGCSGVNDADKARVTAISPIANPNFLRHDLNLPPKQLLEIARRVITSPPYSLEVESAQKGVINTTWKEYPGVLHVVRRWKERTRYQIVVSPDFDDPTGKSSLRVNQETQTRATSQADWFALLDEDRSDRAAELANAIQKAAQSESPR